MKIFGITILTKRQLQQLKSQIRDDEYNRAVSDLVTVLRQKEKIILEPMTLVGDNQTISDCVFIGVDGTSLEIQPAA